MRKAKEHPQAFLNKQISDLRRMGSEPVAKGDPDHPVNGREGAERAALRAERTACPGGKAVLFSKYFPSSTTDLKVGGPPSPKGRLGSEQPAPADRQFYLEGSISLIHHRPEGRRSPFPQGKAGEGTFLAGEFIHSVLKQSSSTLHLDPSPLVGPSASTRIYCIKSWKYDVRCGII